MIVEINISIYRYGFLLPVGPFLHFTFLSFTRRRGGGKRGHNDSDNGVVDGRVEMGLFSVTSSGC